MKKNIFLTLKTLLSLFSLVLLAWPKLLFAAGTLGGNIKDKLNNFAGSGGYTTTAGAYSTSDVAGRIGAMVKVILAFLGVIFLILIITSGFKWMTTSNPDEIKKIRARMINAVIGLAIILASYALTYFIMDQLSQANPNALFKIE